MRPDHDYVGGELLRHPHDLSCRIAHGNDDVDWGAVVFLLDELAGVRPELLEIVGREHDGWVEDCQVWRTGGHRLGDDVQRRDGAGVLSGQRDRPIDCLT